MLLSAISFSLSLAHIECRRISRRARAGFQTAPDEFPPDVLRVIGVGEEIEIGTLDNSFLGKRLEAYDAIQYDLSTRTTGTIGIFCV